MKIIVHLKNDEIQELEREFGNAQKGIEKLVENFLDKKKRMTNSPSKMPGKLELTWAKLLEATSKNEGGMLSLDYALLVITKELGVTKKTASSYLRRLSDTYHLIESVVPGVTIKVKVGEERLEENKGREHEQGKQRNNMSISLQGDSDGR